jgi:hypothetical protein
VAICKLGISPQVQHFLVAAALDQIASVPSNGFALRVIEKLGSAGRARPLVPCIRVTIGLGYDDALNALAVVLSIDFPFK